jgi:hypothetical protein
VGIFISTKPAIITIKPTGTEIIGDVNGGKAPSQPEAPKETDNNDAGSSSESQGGQQGSGDSQGGSQQGGSQQGGN